MRSDRQFDQLQDPSADLNDTFLSERLESRPPCRVLIVDDDDLVRARLAALLKMGDFEVEMAASGEEALRILDRTHCQIVLTDWQMPDMDGISLCRQVRTSAREGYVFIIMLTVRDSKQDMLQGLAAGADDYVIKGAPVEEIMARMEIGRRITHVESSLRTSNRENRRLAVTDSLTGAHNLRYLTKNLPRELSRSRRYNHPLAILSCDIDNFKLINDRYGHRAGDHMLQAFVARASNCIRKASDWLARTGGDEFIVVLPETNLIGAKRVAWKLRRAFAEQPVATCAGPISFMASIGVTSVEAPEDLASNAVIEEMLRAADRGLYDNKIRRKNADRVSTISARKGVIDATKGE